jgi:hypothetical protein
MPLPPAVKLWSDPASIPDALGALRRVVTATDPLAGDRATRLARIKRMFEEAAKAVAQKGS